MVKDPPWKGACRVMAQIKDSNSEVSMNLRSGRVHSGAIVGLMFIVKAAGIASILGSL